MFFLTIPNEILEHVFQTVVIKIIKSNSWSYQISTRPRFVSLFKIPYMQYGCYQGNPSSGASVAHQPSTSRYRTTQLAKECRVATPRVVPRLPVFCRRFCVLSRTPLCFFTIRRTFLENSCLRKTRRCRRRLCRPPVSVRRAVID